jgi:hypothetical protein
MNGVKTAYVVIGVVLVCMLGVLALGLFLGHVW